MSSFSATAASAYRGDRAPQHQKVTRINACTAVALDNGQSCNLAAGATYQNGWCLQCNGVADATAGVGNPADVDACTEVVVTFRDLVETRRECQPVLPGRALVQRSG